MATVLPDLIPRHAVPTLQRMARAFPVLAITGPRQAGKTTLARAAFPRLPHISLEDPHTRELALADAQRFLARYEDGAILDEVQRAPALLSHLLGPANGSTRRGRFVLTGSHQFGVMAGIAAPLAGRVGRLTLLPLSQAELAAHAPARTLEDTLWQGAYPALHTRDRGVDAAQWLAAHLVTYVERDVRQLLNVGNLATFQRFLSLCAVRSAQLLNLNNLAADCGISQPTARQWLTVLQASHIVTLLPPYSRNFGKRLVKTPKLYLLDTGLLCQLLRIGSARELQGHAARGAVFETWVVAETLKHRYNRALPANLHFWRDNHGLEVDLVFEHQGRVHGVECKSGTTYAADWINPARRWRHLVGAQAAHPLLVYGGDQSHTRADHTVLSWRSLQ